MSSFRTVRGPGSHDRNVVMDFLSLLPELVRLSGIAYPRLCAVGCILSPLRGYGVTGLPKVQNLATLNHLAVIEWAAFSENPLTDALIGVAFRLGLG